jgi:pyruvate formate lyase activating enzyme
METATWAASVRHLSPVERKPLYYFRPGIRVLTIASPGCSFTCRYCQNYRISQYGRIPEATWDAEPVAPEELVATAAAGDRAIGLSYTEPSLAAELTEAIARLARPAGVDLIWKTNGYLTPDAGRRLARSLSAVNLDIKGADE